MVAAAWRVTGCVIAAGVVHGVAPPPDALRAGLALLVLVGGLWMTQALHITVTALLVPVLAVLAGLLAPFGHPVIFLFLGGFALAAALQRQGLDRMLADVMLRAARGHRLRAVLLLFAVTALLSMWISNTATAAMMLPLALGLLDDDGGRDRIGPREQVFVLLGVAYSASIGGVGTLVGSPPNAIAAAQAGIGFAEWMLFGVPLVLVLLPLMVVLTALVLRPRLGGRVEPRLERLPWTAGRRVTLVIFALTAAGWIAGAPLARMLGIGADADSLVALMALVALVACRVIEWTDIEQRTRWGVLLLFGGGLALSEAMSRSGASRFLGEQLLAALAGQPAWLVLACGVAFVIVLTELVSNTATAALLVPVFVGLAAALGLPPALPAAAIAVAASCAFMLPVATPPNAVVHGSGLVDPAQMMRCGLLLNAAFVPVIVAVLGALLGWKA